MMTQTPWQAPSWAHLQQQLKTQNCRFWRSRFQLKLDVASLAPLIRTRTISSMLNLLFVADCNCTFDGQEQALHIAYRCALVFLGISRFCQSVSLCDA